MRPGLESAALIVPEEIAAAAWDPVRSAFELPLRSVFHPLGFSVELHTNCDAVLAAAEESWGGLRRMFEEPPLRIDMGVVEDGSSGAAATPLCRARENLMASISDAGNFAILDLSRGFAFSWLTRATVEDRMSFRFNFLEGTVMSLLMGRYLTPIHAACVTLNGRGVLLCGESGAGKSSLSLACARRGWTLVGDDTSSLVRSRKGRTVVGNPRQIRFRESAVQLFPELASERLTRRVNGELAIELATAALPEITTAPQAAVEHVVFLNRQESGPASLADFPREKALGRLEQVLCYGTQEVRDVQHASLRYLLDGDVLELRYSDLDSAVNCLEAMVMRVA